ALERVRAAASQTTTQPSLDTTVLSASVLPCANVTDLATAAELDPGSAWVLSEYAKATALAGDIATAADLAARAAAAAPEDADVQATAGVVLRTAGRAEEAAAAFARALATNPDHAIALVGRASVPTLCDPVAAAARQPGSVTYPRSDYAHLRLADLEPGRVRARPTLRRAERYTPGSVLLRGTVIGLLVRNGDAN